MERCISKTDSTKKILMSIEKNLHEGFQQQIHKAAKTAPTLFKTPAVL
jgi:hypothetical protein